MDKHIIRRQILETVKKFSPAPCNVERIREGLAVELAVKMDERAVAVECLELESRGYLANLKHALDPVYKGISGSAQDQLDQVVKLDPALWGDAAL